MKCKGKTHFLPSEPKVLTERVAQTPPVHVGSPGGKVHLNTSLGISFILFM